MHQRRILIAIDPLSLEFSIMEYRFLGASGFRVPALGFRAGTFGGKGPSPELWCYRLEAASAVMPPYPYYTYWNGPFAERNPPPVQALSSTLA
jgi:hypothetical protein